ncbi:MAG TPA: helix-turn-helix domain-containing protein [Solirubrobacterales bacterium]|nr:helix-turn-helix domain-containing protein [Solirubrobacterales bacterium]
MSEDAALGKALIGPVCDRLRERLAELEGTILGRLEAIDRAGGGVRSVAPPGRRDAVRACLEVALIAIENGGRGDEMQLVPARAVVEARRVAESGEGVGPMLRRYVAGAGVFWDLFLREVLEGEMGEEERARVLLEASAALVSMAAQLLPLVGAAHAKEVARREDPREERTAAVVRALIDCAPVATDGIPYDFDGTHVGLVAAGTGAQRAVRILAAELGCDHLCLPRPHGVVWAWLQVGGLFETKDLPDANRIERGVRIAVGEEADGRLGFRATHRQAQAAMQVAVWQRQPITRYRDVLLLVPAIQDASCRDALISVYLEPLERAPEKNPTLKETLEAYFDSERNTSATAALLRVDRRTATSRLRAVEERLGFPIYAHTAELEIALRLDRLRRQGPEALHDLHTLSMEATGLEAI